MFRKIPPSQAKSGLSEYERGTNPLISSRAWRLSPSRRQRLFAVRRRMVAAGGDRPTTRELKPEILVVEIRCLVPRGVGLLRVVAFGSFSGAPVAQGVGVIRVEPDRLIEVLNGSVVLALASVGGPPVAEGEGVIRRLSSIEDCAF
jgi:hypothetical protein